MKRVKEVIKAYEKIIECNYINNFLNAKQRKTLKREFKDDS